MSAYRSRRAFLADLAATVGAAAAWRLYGDGRALAEDTAAAPPVARRLWSELYCMCGDCDHMTLAACTCEDSARVRAEIATDIERQGYATPSAENAAHAEVIRKYLERFGDKALVANDDRVLRDVGTTAAIVLGVGGLIFVAEHLRRRLTPTSSTASAKKRKRFRR